MPEQQPIAFHTILAHDEQAQIGKTIKFQTITLDTRNTYNQSTGVYTVPESGIYVFTWTLTVGGHTQALTMIMINGQLKGATMADSEEDLDYRTASGTLVTSVNQGDLVHIQLSTRLVTGIIGSRDGQTTFSGWKMA